MHEVDTQPPAHQSVGHPVICTNNLAYHLSTHATSAAIHLTNHTVNQENEKKGFLEGVRQ